jgi:hypothetical protein
MISEQEALDVWRRAKADPVGIAFRTDNRHNLMQRLYLIRARHREEDFSDMMLRNGAAEDEVWVVHRPVTGPAPIPMKPLSEEDLDDI